MPAERPRILMAVFNALDFDGRVQRSAEALSEMAEVKVLALDGGRGFAPKGYDLQVVPTLPGEFGGNRWLHARFLRNLIRLARSYRPSVVYGHDFFMALPAWIAAKLCGARFVYDAHELIIPGSLGRSRGQLQERVWYLLERAIVGRADLVIAANASRAEVMAKQYKLTRVPLVVRNISVPSRGRLTDDVARSRYPALVRKSETECLCVYQGDVDLDRGLGALLDAFQLLPRSYRLLVVGGGPDVEVVRASAKSLELKGNAQIDVVGKVPRDDLFDLLRLCDIGVVCYSFNGLNNIYCAPNKVFEYAQSGIPVVGTAQPPLLELVAKSGIGSIAGEGGPPSPQQMADAIVSTKNRSAGHKGAIRHFLAENTWQREASRLQSAVSELEVARS